MPKPIIIFCDGSDCLEGVRNLLKVLPAWCNQPTRCCNLFRSALGLPIEAGHGGGADGSSSREQPVPLEPAPLATEVKRIKKQVAPVTRWIVAKPAVQNILSQALDANAASLEVSDQVVGVGGGSSGLGDVGVCV